MNHNQHTKRIDSLSFHLTNNKLQIVASLTIDKTGDKQNTEKS